MPDPAAPSPLVSPSYPWWVLPLLGGQVIGIFAGALGASCFIGNETLQTQMFTGAYGLANMAAGYFFGSNAGSQKKDDALAASAIRQNETLAATTTALAASAPAAASLVVTKTEAPDGTTTTTTAPAPPPTPPVGSGT